MASRFNFPTAYDPQIHREETLTLARTTSQKNGIPKVSGSTSNTPSMDSTAPKGRAGSTQHRSFVFTDPVAFKYGPASTFYCSG